MNFRMMIALAALAATLLAQPLARGQGAFESQVVWIPALSNSAQSVKAAPGTLLQWSCVNPNSAAVWVQVYNTLAAVTPGTTASALQLRVAPSSGSGAQLPQVQGPWFASAGIQVAATTTQTGGAAPTTGVDCTFFYR